MGDYIKASELDSSGQVPRRTINHATGYPYSRHDHNQQWIMPDGSREYTWWIEPGDTSTLDKRIEHEREQIAKSQAAIALYETLRAGVVAEARAAEA